MVQMRLPVLFPLNVAEKRTAVAVIFPDIPGVTNESMPLRPEVLQSEPEFVRPAQQPVAEEVAVQFGVVIGMLGKTI